LAALISLSLHAESVFDASRVSEQRGMADQLVRRIARYQQPGTAPSDAAAARSELLTLSPLLSARDFSPESRRAVELAYRDDPSKENMLLAGMADVESIGAEVEQFAKARIEQPPAGMFYGTLPWAANLVRARRGEKDSVEKVLQAAQASDVHVRVVFLLSELAYVPQPEIADYIASFVFSDERLTPFVPDLPGPLHAEYAAAALSRMLADCPVPYKEDYSYTTEEIQVLRDWLQPKRFASGWKFRVDDGKRR
jgi:hypothetical protein